MQDRSDQERIQLGDSRPVDNDLPAYVPSIETRDVFRQMIAMELRNGRLTPARRRRIVRYAAQMGLSAVEAGQLIAACRKEALQSEDPRARHHALRLVEPPPERAPVVLILSVALALAILLDLIFVSWLWR